MASSSPQQVHVIIQVSKTTYDHKHFSKQLQDVEAFCYTYIYMYIKYVEFMGPFVRVVQCRCPAAARARSLKPFSTNQSRLGLYDKKTQKHAMAVRLGESQDTIS